MKINNMKRNILLAVVTLFVTVFAITAWAPKQTPQIYTLKFTGDQLNQLYFALDKSEAPHSMVSMLQAEINKQYSEQVKKDSTQNKK